jgi:GTP-binding protein Era
MTETVRDESTRKFGTIGVLGRTNAGKSTLVNALVGEKVSIVSARPQTTRRRIMGVLTVGSCQMVFCDTPGLHAVRNRLDAFMESVIQETISGLQGALFLVDSASPYSDEDRVFLESLFRTADFPVALCLTKSDLSSPEDRRKLLAAYKVLGPFATVFEISSLKGTQLKHLRKEILTWLPDGPFAYDEEYFTASSEREIAAECIRESALHLYSHEIPHSLAVLIEDFKDREQGKTFVQANLYVERESQKKIIIGAGGAGIKRLGSMARAELKRILGRDIFLELWVKVRPNWRRDADLVKQMGYS